MKMKIGITANVNLKNPDDINLNFSNYTARVFLQLLTAHEIMPLIIPVVPSSLIKEYVDLVDGVLIPGGQDVDPELFHEKPISELGKTYQPHDQLEMQVLQEAIRQHKPVFGICRGYQVINVALGGILYQDLTTQITSKTLKHNQPEEIATATHTVQVAENSNLAKAVGVRPTVNSKHHQGIKQVAPGLRAVARADDGVIEAIENEDASVAGVQWHPEYLWQHDAIQEQLFLDFFQRVKNG
ncbi:hypothetical protein BGL34_04005 [Fructilactobacillus lindneri]|nr:hypothetical protein BGL31_04750 [Fructilactobacillus lindneri]POH24169.1 hypothetical protein BHU33_03055 [Fructilactobacillus lindneri DSM 20690 = JCM 11027]POG99109.1 hypothetical protein BGL32_06035 [Fructilactobacillus lindneri]POH01572.1 hypothetical protein BGL33_05550 [Fructilactobacillus lindneri]POH06178.1 hypothetical protein BGL36_05400 [Fructilactobacillus lindneri]